MCGIAGILTDRDDLDLAPPLAAMLAALRHRGPDDEGCEQIALAGGLRLGLAHSRLSVIDLSSAGHQPMHDEVSGSWIVYNGEVYNHRDIRQRLTGIAFRSTSDTETILQGWATLGPEVLPLLRGMFGIALYDGRRRQLWLVRDRLGVKPLYASRAGPGTWLFASELRALLASGLVHRRLDRRGLESYLAFGATAAPWTLVHGVESLLPGECWRFDLDGAETPEPHRIRYWRPQFVSRAAPPMGYEEAVESVRPVLLDAVKLRMLADVPVGVFLSGGIDSTSIVAALTAQGYALRTFSVVFCEREYDESSLARLVAQRFGTEHTELRLNAAQVFDEFDSALAAYDQPSIDGLNSYFIAQATRRAGVKVALSGVGGDELFAGYRYFRMLARLDKGLARHAAWVLQKALACFAPRSIRTIKLRALLQGHGSRIAGYVVCREVMDAPRREELLARGVHGASPLPPALHAELKALVADLDPVNAHSLLELSLYLANMLLRDTDQMSMAHALEVRTPFVDHALVHTVGQIPGTVKLAPGRRARTKGLLVDALPVDLPGEILGRPKMGFVLPWNNWLRNELKDRIGEILSDRPTLRAVGLNPSAVGSMWGQFLASRPGIRYSDILCLVHLIHWARQHNLAMEEETKPALYLEGIPTKNFS